MVKIAYVQQCGSSITKTIASTSATVKLSGHRFESHCGPFASNLEQVANLRCAQVTSGQLSLLPFAGREMSSSLWATG